MEERLAEENDDEDFDEDEDQVKSFKSAKKGPASKKRRMQQDSQEEEESELDEDIDDEPKAPAPKKKLQKINNAPVHPYDNGEDEDDGAVNPFQPVAPNPIKLPAVKQLGGKAGKPVNYDFSNPFGGPQG